MAHVVSARVTRMSAGSNRCQTVCARQTVAAVEDMCLLSCCRIEIILARVANAWPISLLTNNRSEACEEAEQIAGEKASSILGRGTAFARRCRGGYHEATQDMAANSRRYPYSSSSIGDAALADPSRPTNIAVFLPEESMAQMHFW